MKVNNYEKIKGMISFESRDSYYFLQIISRRKDNPDQVKDAIHVADYYITSFENFETIFSEISSICDSLNARAYFRINRRSFKKSALESLKLIVENVVSEDYRAVRKAFASASGRCPADPDKRWIIDIDWKDLKPGTDRNEYIDGLKQILKGSIEKTGRDSSIDSLETKNGVHLVCRPFNLKEFRDSGHLMDVHKDNMVILYCP